MIEIKNLHIQYHDIILEHGEIKVPNGHLTLITGKNGIGKTTLLYKLGLISDNQDFEYFYNGEKLATKRQRESFRTKHISFVLQDMYFVSHFTVLETIKYFMKLASQDYDNLTIDPLLDSVGLEININQRVETLSLGEKQRLSIVCSLIKNPKLLILDEPTASLDADNERQIFEILHKLAKTGVHIVIASHSEVAKEYCDVIYHIENKELVLIKNECECLKNKKTDSRKLSLKFLFDYARKYINNYRFIYVFAILILTLSVVSSVTFNVVTNEMKNNDIAVLEKQFDNKILITNDENCLFLDQDYSQYMSSFEMDNTYPLYQMKMNIDNEDINIVPYFHEDLIKQSLSSSFHETKEGIYVDRITYQRYKNSNNPTMNITVYDKNQSFDLEKTFHINGVLVDNFNQYYTSRPQRFIFMPYESMQQIYELFPTSHQYPAYVAMFDSYRQLEECKTNLQEEGYTVNDAFVDIQALKDIETYYTHLQALVNMIIFIIMITIDLIIISHLHLQKRKENIFLRVNGLTMFDMVKIDFFEYIIEILTTFVFSASIITVILAFSTGIDIEALKIVIFMISMYFVVFLIERLLLAYMEYHNYTIEKVLRENEVN